MSEIEWKPFEDRCYENAVKAHVGRVRVVVEENTDRDPHERFYVHAEVDGLQDHECNAGTLGQYRTTLDEAKAAGLELAAKLEAWMSGVSRELSFDRLRDRNTARCESAYHPISAWSPTDWACAMAGECGEACNLVKKLKRLERPSTHSLQPERDILSARSLTSWLTS